MALKAGVKRRAGGLGLVLAGHRAGPAGVGRDLGAQATLLLVLDTCEYLLGACATLAGAMLRGAAGVTVLATSRQPLDAVDPIQDRCPHQQPPYLRGLAVEHFGDKGRVLGAPRSCCGCASRGVKGCRPSGP